MALESSSCTLLVAFSEHALFCVVGECSNLSSVGSPCMFSVCSHEIASAKMLSLPFM